ncbi:MAG: hypothetical protein ACR2JH_00955 [Solirubrobacteraceae bacterium]
MADPEPLEAFAEETKQVARSIAQRIVDSGREWLTGQLVALLIGAVGSSALAIAVLPIFAGVACALVTLAAVIYAIYARRLLATERRNRRWAHIQGKRVQQQQLRAQASVDNAVLLIGGDRQASVGTLRNRDLAQAVRHLLARLHQSALASRPHPQAAAQHQPAMPPAPDLTAVRRRLEQRQAEIKALEAEIQALSVPGDQALEAVARENRQAERDLSTAAREADRLARDRQRRGLTPTMPAGRELGLQLQIGPEGVRDVQRQPPTPTPEQIAAKALEQEPPRGR